jgi:hypothetical protein
MFARSELKQGKANRMKDGVTALLPGLVSALHQPDAFWAGVIPWASPIPVFGNPALARVATLGINPSSREFADASGHELEGSLRRLHTLRSLGLHDWQQAEPSHLEAIRRYCLEYFHRRPYDAWFKKLDYILNGVGATYYGFANSACHLDLVPYATSPKWGELRPDQRGALLGMSQDSLGLLVRDSPIRVLILNGRSVVSEFERTGFKFESLVMPSWTLPRQKLPGVVGLAKLGVATRIAAVDLGREVLVLGFNHNVQSSFGVTRTVMRAIRDWVAEVAAPLVSEPELDRAYSHE